MDLEERDDLGKDVGKHWEYRRRVVPLITDEMPIIREMDEDGW